MADEAASSMSINEVRNFLPHRYPFLLVDRVLKVVPGESITAIKNVTANEPFFQGHFPHQPVMPGVLIIEAMAQATGVLSFITSGTKPSDGENYFLAGVNEARFKRIVEPGDQLLIQIDIIKKKKYFGQFKCTAHVGDELACSADLLTARRGIKL